MESSKSPPEASGPASLPSVDILDDAAVWTPEIEYLVQAVVEQIRLDQPGMIVNGPQRNGKSRACGYVEAVLADCVGYPVTTFTWTIPEAVAATTRVFIQERMLQSGCNAIGHRDLAVLRNRLINHMTERATADGAKRIVIIVDEAQNLGRNDYGALVFIFNELERRRLRPFFLLVGQPELGKLSQQWVTEDAQQMVGRFSTRTHDYLGIRLDDLEVVLAGFDDEEDGPEATAAFRTAPTAYAEGWRVQQLAPMMRDAVRRVAAAQNVQEDVRLPMQYLRACLLSMLYRIVQRRMRPQVFQLSDAIDCVKSSNFGKVLQYYVRTGVGTGGELRGTPGTVGGGASAFSEHIEPGSCPRRATRVERGRPGGEAAT